MSKQWKVDDSEGAIRDRAASGIYYIANERDHVVAETMVEEYARLIAAAPELLEWAKAALDAWENGPKEAWEKAAEELEQAIKKAEGSNESK